MSGTESKTRDSGPSKGGKDDRFLHRLWKDDTEVLADVYQAYSTGLRRRLTHVLHRSVHGDLDDLLSETLVRLWEHRHALKPDTPLEGWLYVVARNLGIDLLRKRESLTDSPVAGIEEPSGTDPADSELVTALQVALEELDEVERQILSAFARHGEGGRWAADLAEELPLTAEAIRVRKHRLLEKLRSTVTRELERNRSGTD